MIAAWKCNIRAEGLIVKLLKSFIIPTKQQFTGPNAYYKMSNLQNKTIDHNLEHFTEPQGCGSGVFAWIMIRCLTSLDPDLVSVPGSRPMRKSVQKLLQKLNNF